jgi:hypothetical protein
MKSFTNKALPLFSLFFGKPPKRARRPFTALGLAGQKTKNPYLQILTA